MRIFLPIFRPISRSRSRALRQAGVSADGQTCQGSIAPRSLCCSAGSFAVSVAANPCAIAAVQGSTDSAYESA